MPVQARGLRWVARTGNVVKHVSEKKKNLESKLLCGPFCLSEIYRIPTKFHLVYLSLYPSFFTHGLAFLLAYMNSDLLHFLSNKAETHSRVPCPAVMQ